MVAWGSHFGVLLFWCASLIFDSRITRWFGGWGWGSSHQVRLNMTSLQSRFRDLPSPRLVHLVEWGLFQASGPLVIVDVACLSLLMKRETSQMIDSESEPFKCWEWDLQNQAEDANITWEPLSTIWRITTMICWNQKKKKKKGWCVDNFILANYKIVSRQKVEHSSHESSLFITQRNENKKYTKCSSPSTQ